MIAIESTNGALLWVLSTSAMAETDMEGREPSLPSLVLLLRERRLLDLLIWRRPLLTCAASISACIEDGDRTLGTEPDFTNARAPAAVSVSGGDEAVATSDAEARVSASEMAAASAEGLVHRLMAWGSSCCASTVELDPDADANEMPARPAAVCDSAARGVTGPNSVEEADEVRAGGAGEELAVAVP